jgi:hypothetical protein
MTTNNKIKVSGLEIVERSSGFWIVDNNGVAWDQPFTELDGDNGAIATLDKLVAERIANPASC